MTLVLTLSMQIPGAAQTGSRDLTDISLEDLMNIQVTSVSKKEQKLSRTGAAVFVITQEDIHRSGATNIPDLLRMAPGVNVAQINANSWAISVRGFNGPFADKVLVLIDGRSVFSPDTSGVFWDQQDVPLEDIERIEIIRGEISLVGQNLLTPRHAEFPDFYPVLHTQVERSVFGKITWRF